MPLTSMRSPAFLALLFAAACQEGPSTAPADSDLSVQAALADAGTAAVRSGETDRAEGFGLAGDALRWGIRPSEIEVKIKNEKFRYLAIMVGVVRRGADGQPVLFRSLVAWTGRPPKALLQISAKSDQALFGHPGSDGPEVAHGIWNDLVNQQRWVATAGSADLALVSTGNACPVQPGNPALKCSLGSYDIRVNGNFQLLGVSGPDGEPVEIHTKADAVNGVVIGPAN